MVPSPADFTVQFKTAVEAQTNTARTGEELPNDFKAGIANFLAKGKVLLTSLADVIAINNEAPANRALHGYGYLGVSRQRPRRQRTADS